VDPPIDRVLDKLAWMRERSIWPNGLRYLWTDAFGVILLVSLHKALGGDRWIEEAEGVVGDVERVLGRKRGLRIGQAPDRDGQYFHYLAMWIFALEKLGRFRPEYRKRAIEVVREIHPAFVLPRRGVIWKMKEDLSGPYPGYGLGALDPFHGYVVYRLLDPEALADEIEDMRTLVEASWAELTITQDLGLGMMLWMTHFFPDEPWAAAHRTCSRGSSRAAKRAETASFFALLPRAPRARAASARTGSSSSRSDRTSARTEGVSAPAAWRPSAQAAAVRTAASPSWRASVRRGSLGASPPTLEARTSGWARTTGSSSLRNSVSATSLAPSGLRWS